MLPIQTEDEVCNRYIFIECRFLFISLFRQRRAKDKGKINEQRNRRKKKIEHGK